MSRKITSILLKTIDLSHIDLNLSSYINKDGKPDPRLGYNIHKQFLEDRSKLKNELIEALKECDDFSIEYSTDDYWGNECELHTYKIEIESDKDFEERKRKANIASKKSQEKRKINKEKEEREQYEKLKKKFN
jgi:hypothetical protein